tara:strand:- start:291 stop:2228 length:1938 start_codon:yes stop_codon:yes gene_type:complete
MKTRSKSNVKDELKKQPIKASKKQIIVPKKYPTSLANKNYNDSNEMYTLEMQILTNYSKGKPTLLTNNMLVIPELDKKEGENLALESYPFFTYKVDYPIQKLRSIVNYQDRVNVFFNKTKFINYILKFGTNSVLKNEKQRNERMENNILAMLEILFPTSFPVIDNIHTSYNFLKSETSLKPLYVDHLFNAGYTSNINIDGQTKTIKKVILYNDIVNHPIYRELIDGTINFIDYAEENNPDFLLKTIEELEKDYNKKKNDSLPIQYTNHEISFLNQYRASIRTINNEKLQNLIEHNYNDEVKKFYKLIQYLYNYYIRQYATEEVNPEFEELIKNGISSLNLKDIRNPKKEVYVMLELHTGDINDPNFDKCNYYDGEVTNKLEKFMQGSLNNENLLDNAITQTKNTTAAPNIGNRTFNNNIMKPIKKEELPLTEAEMIEINNILLDIMRKYRDMRTGKNKNNSLLQGVNQFIEKMKADKPASSKYNEYLQNSTSENIVKNIIKNKFKPQEESKRISPLFAEILKGWKKELNKPNKIYNEKLYSKISDLSSAIENEKEKEMNKITTITRSINIPDKDEKIKIINYHKVVYDFYKFILMNIIKPSLDYNFNKKNEDFIKIGQVKKSSKGGKITLKKNQSNKNKTLKNLK